MLDVVGKTLNDDDKRRIAHPMTGGVILFARHLREPRAAHRADRCDPRDARRSC